jgi:CDP-diacylglycerol--serine O-phosphatidyltransferase
MAAVPGVRFLPNAITVLALCSGLTAVAFAYRGQYLFAVGAISAAAILDSLDGPTARLLRSTSRIGAELDSLSDCISFGVAPALVMFIWLLHSNPIGWAVCLVYAVCAALRLARFNSLLDDDDPKPYAKGFFTGVPSPAGGLLAPVPLLMEIRFGAGWWSNSWLTALWMTIVGLLMVSRLPSIALKSVRVAPTLIAPLLILLVAGVAALFYEPEVVLSLGLLVYLLHLPYAGWKYLHLKQHPELWGERPSRARPPGRRVLLAVRMPRPRRVAGRGPDGSPLPVEHRRGVAGLRRGSSRRRLR